VNPPDVSGAVVSRERHPGDSGGHDEAASKAAIESAIFGSGEARKKRKQKK